MYRQRRIAKDLYFQSEEFLAIKSEVDSLVVEHNAVGEYVTEIYSKGLFDLGASTTGRYAHLASVRKVEYQNYKGAQYEPTYHPNVHNASLQVVSNAERDPIHYLMKYFHIYPDVETLKEVQQISMDIDRLESAVENLSRREEDILDAVSLIRAAKKPYVLVGGGAILSDASDELRSFVSKIDAPVADTLMGKGAFDGSDPKYTGMVGMHGTKTSNLGITECDLLIVIGARFSDRVIGNAKKFAKNAKILHIDVDAAEISKNIKAHYSLVGDARLILRKLNSRLDPLHHDEWIAHIERLKDMYPIRTNKQGLTGEYIIETIDKKTKDETIICTEVGQHQMWAAQFYKYTHPRTLITSGGLGTMGYGLGASIGAKVAEPDKTVVNIAGDGCFRMNMNEIATATRYDIPIIQVVINNHVLGMVRQWQNLFYGKRYSQTILRDKVDFVKLAEAMGARAKKVTTKEEFDAAFDEALKSNTTFVIDCEIDSDEKVFPMVSPGAAISDAFDEKDLKLHPVK